MDHTHIHPFMGSLTWAHAHAHYIFISFENLDSKMQFKWYECSWFCIILTVLLTYNVKLLIIFKCLTNYIFSIIGGIEDEFIGEIWK